MNDKPDDPDRRLYAKFTLDFPDDPKIRPLSAEAFRCLVEAILWSRQQLTDGFIPKRYAVARWSLAACCELTENDPDAPSFTETEQSYVIHNFAGHQTTKAEIEAVRAVRRVAGRRGGIASGEARRSKAQAKPKQTPSKTNPETETETEQLNPDGLSVLAPRPRGEPQNGPRVSEPPEPPPMRYAPQTDNMAFYVSAEIQNCELCDDDGYRGNHICDHIDRAETVRNGMAQVRAALQKKPQPL